MTDDWTASASEMIALAYRTEAMTVGGITYDAPTADEVSE